MPSKNDIVGAIQVLRSAGIDIKSSSGYDTPDDEDFGSGWADDDDDDISGADIIGAMRNAAKGKNLTHKQKKALNQLAKTTKKENQASEFRQLADAMSSANKPGVRQDDQYILRGLVLGMGSIIVPGPGVNTLSARAQEAIRIQRIELDPNGASFANLFVSSIVVGVRPQSANLQEMPLISFAFNATGSYLRGNTVDRGQDFQINLRSGTAVATTITGVVFGESLQP